MYLRCKPPGNAVQIEACWSWLDTDIDKRALIAPFRLDFIENALLW